MQEGLNLFQNAEMDTKVSNKIKTMISNQTFQEVNNNCSTEHNFTNRAEFNCSGTSSIDVKKLD